MPVPSSEMDDAHAPAEPDAEGMGTAHVRSAGRDVLPVPDIPAPGLVTYDAKDPDTSFAPIEQLRPPAGAPERPGRPDRRRGLRLVERVRRAVRDAERGAARGRRPEVQPLPHDGAVLADARGAAERPQPPHGRHGRDHGDRDGRAGLQLDAPEHVRAAGGDPQAQRLLDRAVRQVPRGAGLADEPDGAVRQLADAAAASSTSTASSAARRTSTTRRSTRARRRSSRTARPRRATTSWAT